MAVHAETGAYDRPSDGAHSMDVLETYPPQTSGEAATSKLAIPASWIGLGGYLGAGVFLGLALILMLSIGRGGPETPSASANAITDNVVRLHANDIGESCWSGRERSEPARLTVSLDVGVDGKIRSASAEGGSVGMRGCVEAHVKSWEFLPQLEPQTLALPVEVDRL